MVEIEQFNLFVFLHHLKSFSNLHICSNVCVAFEWTAWLKSIILSLFVRSTLVVTSRMLESLVAPMFVWVGMSPSRSWWMDLFYFPWLGIWRLFKIPTERT
ncbi:hypothetical protein Cni_G28327 [Canna indica]|uniref:Uncharacterized protein n=1 Tax=Canna indica TaxID=4628 RepID=A0AAQ3QQ65_9LILI|nr:hypothetical protein Cni_G28327 [Canna indica]